MTPASRKLWITAIPILVGALILISLWRINAVKSSAPSAAGSGAGTPVVPENAAHEKASLEEQLQKNPDHVPILMRLAELERDAGRPAGAVAHLKKILEKDPAHQDARLELGRALYDAGDTEGALKETLRLLADHPENVDGLYNLGAIYANQNQLALARQYWAKAVAVNPQSESGQKSQEALQKTGAAK